MLPPRGALVFPSRCTSSRAHAGETGGGHRGPPVTVSGASLHPSWRPPRASKPLPGLTVSSGLGSRRK